MQKLDFWTPVVGNLSTQKDPLAFLRLCEGYFEWKNRSVQIVRIEEGLTYVSQPASRSRSNLLTALKVLSAITLIIPLIALVGKVIWRAYHACVISDPKAIHDLQSELQAQQKKLQDQLNDVVQELRKKSQAQETELQALKENTAGLEDRLQHMQRELNLSQSKAAFLAEQIQHLEERNQLYLDRIQTQHHELNPWEQADSPSPNSSPDSAPSESPPLYLHLPYSMAAAAAAAADSDSFNIIHPDPSPPSSPSKTPSPPILGRVYDAVTSYFVDSNHPWKQQKYHLCLTELRNALPEIDLEYYESESASPLQKLMLPCLKILVADSKEDPRSQILGFMQNFREVLSSEEYTNNYAKKIAGHDYDASVNLALAVCEARFTKVEVYSFLEYMVNLAINSGIERDPNLLEALAAGVREEDFKAIEAASSKVKGTEVGNALSKVRGELGFNFDPHLGTNPPYVFGDLPLSNEKQVRLIRMGTATMENSYRESKVTPEFYGFMQSHQAQGKKHLYVSLQTTQYSRGKHEKERNDCLKALEEDFPGTFNFVILDQDSAFYKRSNTFNGLRTLERFKEEFANQLFSTGTGYYFPSHWLQEEAFKNRLIELMDIVHKSVFDKEELTSQDCKDFIEIYYAFLTPYLMAYSNADTANESCKDDMDRGGKCKALLFELAAIINGTEETDEHKNRLKTLTHAAAFWVKKQAIIHSRRSRLMSALELLKKSEVREKIKSVKERLDIRGEISIHKKEGQLL